MKNPKLGKITTITGWVFSVLFAVMGISCGGLSLLFFLIGAVLISPTFRNHVYLSGKVWIPLVVILFFAGVAISPQAESGPDEITDKQASVASSGKQNKKDTGKKKSKKEKQEQAEAQANAGLNAFNTYNNPEQQQTSSNYVLNNNTMKFHYPSCRDVPKIAPENYATFDGTRDDALNRGYSPCGHCNP